MPAEDQDLLGLLDFLVSAGPHHSSPVVEERQGTLEREPKPVEQIDVVSDCFKI